MDHFGLEKVHRSMKWVAIPLSKPVKFRVLNKIVEVTALK